MPAAQHTGLILLPPQQSQQHINFATAFEPLSLTTMVCSFTFVPLALCVNSFQVFRFHHVLALKMESNPQTKTLCFVQVFLILVLFEQNLLETNYETTTANSSMKL